MQGKIIIRRIKERSYLPIDIISLVTPPLNIKISVQESGVGWWPISDVEKDDSQDESGVPDVSVIWIIVSTMGPASGIVTNGEALGYKLDLSIVAVMKLSLILRAAVFFRTCILWLECTMNNQEDTY